MSNGFWSNRLENSINAANGTFYNAINLFNRISSTFCRASMTDKIKISRSEILYITRHGRTISPLYWDIPWSWSSGIIRPLSGRVWRLEAVVWFSEEFSMHCGDFPTQCIQWSALNHFPRPAPKQFDIFVDALSSFNSFFQRTFNFIKQLFLGLYLPVANASFTLGNQL